MMLLPNRRHIEESDPHVHRILERVAEVAFEHAESHVPLTMLEGIDLQPALGSNFLAISGDAAIFPNKELQQAYTVRYAADKLGLVWDNLAAFAESFNNIERHGYKFGGLREFGAAVLISLATDDQRDLVGRMVELAQMALANNERSAFWDLYPPFCKALPMLDIDANRFAHASDVILQASAKDMMGGMIYGAVEEYAAQSYDNADSLYQALIAEPERKSVDLIVNTLCGLSVLDIHKAHQYALDLVESQVAQLHEIGILALGRLKYSNKDTDSLLTTTLTRLGELRSIGNNADDIVLVQAYGDLLVYAPTASSVIVAIAQCSDLRVKHAASWVLMRHADKTDNKVWVKETLLNLAGYYSCSCGILTLHGVFYLTE